MAAKPTPERKRRSGPNIPEHQRTTEKVQLRLDPEIVEDLDALASRWRVKRSAAVSRLVEMATETESTSEE